MRIPVKTELNGYTPALDPFSKDKLVWYKTKKGLPYNLIITGSYSAAIVGSIWSVVVGANQDGYEVNVYKYLGHDKFILLFIIASIIGVLGYIWALFVYDLNKIKDFPLKESIELYDKTTIYTKDTKERMKQWWWAIPSAAGMTAIVFYILFTASDRVFSGAALGIDFYLTAILVYLALYQPTVYFSRKYLDRKFNIKSRK